MSYKTIIFSSGISIGVRRVSPMLMLDLRRKFPEPQPPLNKVVIDDVTTMEPNPSDPDYLLAKSNYEAEMEEKFRRVIVRRGVNYILTDEDKVEVAQVRQDYQDLTGDEIHLTDLEVFISYVAILSEEDLNLLINTVTGISQPTEEKVADHTALYKSDVPGS